MSTVLDGRFIITVEAPEMTEQTKINISPF